MPAPRILSLFLLSCFCLAGCPDSEPVTPVRGLETKPAPQEAEDDSVAQAEAPATETPEAESPAPVAAAETPQPTTPEPEAAPAVTPDDPDAVVEASREAVAAFAERHARYVADQGAAASPADRALLEASGLGPERRPDLWEAQPRVLLLPGLGMFSSGKDARAAAIVGEIYRHTAWVIRASAYSFSASKTTACILSSGLSASESPMPARISPDCVMRASASSHSDRCKALIALAAARITFRDSVMARSRAAKRVSSTERISSERSGVNGR